MRQTLFTLMLGIGAAGIARPAMAQSTLIHYWNFNSFTVAYHLPSIPGIAADFSIHDTTKAKILYAKLPGTVLDSAYIDSYSPAASGAGPDFDTVNARMGATSGYALRVRNPSDSMQLLFYIPTVHYQNIVLKYGCEKSSNGMLTQNFDYSIDSGASWITTGLSATSYTTRDSFRLASVSFGNPAANNNARLVFRIKFSGNTIGTSGNNRFDNVTVEGDSMSTTAGQILAEKTEYKLYPNPANNMLFIEAPTTALRSYTIYDVSGQRLKDNTTDQRSFSIDISNLPHGTYLIKLLSEDLINSSTMMFMKQ